jgi:hypothetical protein
MVIRQKERCGRRESYRTATGAHGRMMPISDSRRKSRDVAVRGGSRRSDAQGELRVGDNLDGDLSVAGAVEFAEIDSLPRSEDQFPAIDQKVL